MYTKFCIEVSGNLAMFADTLSKTGGEKISYQLPTQSGIQGLIKSIFWKPEFEVVVDRIRVLNPIKYTSRILKHKDSEYNGSDLFNHAYLHDVKYQIEFHIVVNSGDKNDYKKYNDMMNRYVNGIPRFIPYLGTTECTCKVHNCVFGEGDGYYDNSPKQYFNNILLEVHYQGIKPNRFIYASTYATYIFENGIIDFDQVINKHTIQFKSKKKVKNAK